MRRSILLLILITCYNISFGQEIDSITDFRDGQVYRIVKIAQDWWMAENLNTGARIDASVLQSDNEIIEKYCYEDDPGNCLVYGGLYTWEEMMEYNPPDAGNPGTTKGICPIGWHVPTYYDWGRLIDSTGGATIAGGALKDTGTVYWTSPNTGALNSSGFSALPAGQIDPGGSTSIRQCNS